MSAERVPSPDSDRSTGAARSVTHATGAPRGIAVEGAQNVGGLSYGLVMAQRTDYELWTLESLDRLVAARGKLRMATTAKERGEALRLIDLAHEEAVDLVEQRDHGEPRSVSAFPAGFHGSK